MKKIKILRDLSRMIYITGALALFCLLASKLYSNELLRFGFIVLVVTQFVVFVVYVFYFYRDDKVVLHKPGKNKQKNSKNNSELITRSRLNPKSRNSKINQSKKDTKKS